MVVRGIRSIQVVAEEVRSERAAQLSHFDAVDTKAGVLLGFAGAIVALSSGSSGSLAASGRWLAVLAGLFALSSFWPRRYWTTDLRGLREAYLAAEPAFTELHLLDSQIVFAERAHQTLWAEGAAVEGFDGDAWSGDRGFGDRTRGKVTGGGDHGTGPFTADDGRHAAPRGVSAALRARSSTLRALGTGRKA